MNWTASTSTARPLPAVGQLCGYRPVMLLHSVISLFVLAAFLSKGVSLNYQKNCSLDLSAFFVLNRSGCGGGTWGGFLSEGCCSNGFDQYLYALGRKANKTGKVYLNATEQMDCLPLMEDTFGRISNCGIDRLTSGKGGCSELTVDDVLNELGVEVKTLYNDCKLLDHAVGAGRGCDLCLKRWDEIGGSYFKDRASANLSPDVCKFAVLLTLTSTSIMDEKQVLQIYKCLGEHLGDLRVGSNRSGENNFIKLGIWLLMGSFLALVAVVLFVFWSLVKKQPQLDKPDPPQEREASKESLLEDTGCQKIPVKEIYAATNDLNALNFIGQGIAGKVYKGILPNGRDVAVKHIVRDVYMETFLREVTSLSHVRHPNLVSLIGYCEEQDEYFLVYELCSNGNLSEWLFVKDKKLSWIQRLEIAVGSARGLWFLHTYGEGCIVHRDIKPANILLGANFEAKLSDFGLSKVMDAGVSHVSSEVRGTFGYVDPEYRQNRRVNPAADVYSFGMVLLQILSGKRVVNLDAERPLPLGKMARRLMKGDNITEFADPKLNGELFPTEAFVLTLQVALSCTGDKRERPSMGQVVTRLEDALDISSTRKRVPSSSSSGHDFELGKSEFEPTLHHMFQT